MTIAAIVAVMSILSAVLGAIVSAVVAAAVPDASVWRVWLLTTAAVDAIAIYATFERRASLWGRIVSRGRPRTPAIAVTFDDGPTEPYTSQILDVLRAFDARGTFFVLGARAVAAAPVLRRMRMEGHEIGNHTWEHAALPLRTPETIRATIRDTSDVVERSTGLRPRLFRAPYGWRSPLVDRAARQEGCTPVAWTVGVHDTDRPGAAAIAQRAIEQLDNGVILLLHDGRSFDPEPDASQVVEALPVILMEARRRGLRLLTMSELLMESGPDA